MLSSISPFTCWFSLFKQLNRQGYCVLLFSLWECKSLNSSCDSSRWTHNWLQMACKHSVTAEKSDEKQQELCCGEISFTSVLPTGAVEALALLDYEAASPNIKPRCAERSLTPWKRHDHGPSAGLNPMMASSSIRTHTAESVILFGLLKMSL